MEDKQLICDLLALALKRTREYSDLISLVYDEEEETVRIFFTKGSKKANVALDSGSAMIRDIIYAIR